MPMCPLCGQPATVDLFSTECGTKACQNWSPRGPAQAPSVKCAMSFCHEPTAQGSGVFCIRHQAELDAYWAGNP